MYDVLFVNIMCISCMFASLSWACSSPVAGVPVAVEKNTHPEKKTVGKISFQSTKSEAGLQCLPPDCMAKAGVKGAFLHRQRYHGHVVAQ